MDSDYKVSGIKASFADNHIIYLCDVENNNDLIRVCLAVGPNDDADELYFIAKERWQDLIRNPQKSLTEVFTETIEYEQEEEQ